MTPRTRRRRPTRALVSRDSLLFTLGAGCVIYQQATGRVSIPLLLFAAAATLAPGTLQLLAPILTAFLSGTGSSSPPSPSPSSPPSSPQPPAST